LTNTNTREHRILTTVDTLLQLGHVDSARLIIAEVQGRQLEEPGPVATESQFAAHVTQLELKLAACSESRRALIESLPSPDERKLLNAMTGVGRVEEPLTVLDDSAFAALLERVRAEAFRRGAGSTGGPLLGHLQIDPTRIETLADAQKLRGARPARITFLGDVQDYGHPLLRYLLSTILRPMVQDGATFERVHYRSDFFPVELLHRAPELDEDEPTPA
jgi:hypothetical protein